MPTLGIAGIGLIGGSIALRARSAGYTTVACDRDAAALDAARAADALDDIAPDIAALAQRCDVVAIALPVDATIAALRDTPALARPALVFDVASVKEPIVAAAQGLARFVPSHPLAGRETSGFSSADATLFEGRAWVVDPHADAAARALLGELIASCGARAVELGAADHDRLVALTSHLPQALAAALGKRLANAGVDDARVYEVSGPGIASMLRLARSPAALWSPIFAANARPLAAELRSLARTLDDAATDLERGEVDALMSYLADAASAVAMLERNASGARSLPYALPTR